MTNQDRRAARARGPRRIPAPSLACVLLGVPCLFAAGLAPIAARGAEGEAARGLRETRAGNVILVELPPLPPAVADDPSPAPGPGRDPAKPRPADEPPQAPADPEPIP